MNMQGIPRRPLGRTGWSASVLGLGGVRYNFLDDEGAAAVVHRALDLGINVIDTAHGYSDSEHKIGLALAGRRQEVFLHTKSGQRTYDSLKAEFEESLRRLQTDVVDLFFIHGIHDEADRRQILQPGGVLKAVEEYRAAGHIRFVGLSGHNDREAMRQALRDYDFDAVLFPLGAFNRVRYSFEEAILPVAREKGLAVLGMKIAGSGKLKEAADVAPYFRYSLNLPVDVAVVGVDNLEQLEQNVAAVRAGLPPLTAAEWEALRQEAWDLTREFREGEWCWLPEHAREGADD
jgi:aryl-alcohol dehydrogenase-like predicted oxidoreductase